MAKQVIECIKDNSLDIYDALVNKELNITKLYNSIKSDKEFDTKKIKKISTSRVNKIVSNYSKTDILNNLIDLMDNRFTHLKEIRNIVNIDKLVNYVITNKILLDKVKVDYANKIIDLLLEKYYDYKDIKLLSQKKEELIDIERVINSNIIRNISDYYIRKITI